MATIVIYDTAPASNRTSWSTDAVYATAREGAGLTLPGFTRIGQGTGFNVYQSFFRFDTSGLSGASISAVVLSLDGDSDGSTEDFTMDARLYEWGDTLETTDFRAGSALGALTLLATWSSAGYAAGYNDFTSDAAFVSNINTSGYTRLVVASAKQAAGTTPTTGEHVTFTSPATVTPPKLTITFTGGAPMYVGVSAGANDIAGAWVCTGSVPSAVGNIVILQVLQDGTGAAANITLTSATNIEDLGGTDNTWTKISAWDVGSAVAARQHLWIGRSINTSGAPTFTGGNVDGNDLYFRMYEFTNCDTGTTLATVIENTTGGSTTNTAGTNAGAGDATDAAVVTTTTNRLALNFVGADANVTIAQYVSMTGGTWVEVAEYTTATGTDAAIQLQYAVMTSAGTIDGGTAAINAAAAWGVVGFALIGIPVVDRIPYFRPYTQLLAH